MTLSTTTKNTSENTMKDILVHLNDSPDSRLWVSMKLAELFASHVTGLHIKQPLSYEYLDAEMNPVLIREFEAREDEAAGKSRAILETYFADKSTSSNYIEIAGDPSHQLIKHACTYDIIVVGKPDTGQHYEQRVAVPANLALGSGRPVLIVPKKLQQNTLGENVLVAWNGTRESTRALHDSMPILTRAKAVNIVSFNTQKSKQEDSRCAALEEHLTRYDVTFDLLNSSLDDSEIGTRLLELASRFDSDMIVMGAYGHSRIREYILGGASRSMIRDVPVPLFVSH